MFYSQANSLFSADMEGLKSAIKSRFFQTFSGDAQMFSLNLSKATQLANTSVSTDRKLSGDTHPPPDQSHDSHNERASQTATAWRQQRTQRQPGKLDDLCSFCDCSYFLLRYLFIPYFS